MPFYFIRAELLDASSEQYDQMHEAMNNGGYRRTITYQDGALHQLPTGCYMGLSNNDSIYVRDYTKAVAEIIGVRAYIFVCLFDEYVAELPPA